MKKTKTKCYLYTRVSTSMQVDGYSLDAQRDKLRKYAEYEDMVVAGEYSDEGFSGKNIQGRHEFQRMLQDIQDGKDGVEYVLVFKLSRFGRNAADVLNSLQLMQDFGVNLICVEDGIDSSKDSGKLMISVLSAVAEIERENIRTQTMAGREQKAREGKWNGGFAPYGYRLEKGELLIAEDEVDVIRTIFDRYIHTNDGVSGVAKYLNRQGFVKKLRQNGTIPGFSASFVKSIIDNPVYMGKIAYGRRRTEKKIGTRNEMHVVEQSEFPVYEGKHEAIISEEDWNLAQEKRKVNAYRREKVNDPTHAHILSGILKCPCCGKSLYGNIAKAHSKDKKTRYYYYCKNTVTPTGHECTFRLNIEQTEMNRMVASIISAMVSDPRFADAIKAKIGSAVDTNDLEKQLEALQAQLRQTLGTKARLERQMDGLDVNDPYYDRKFSDLQRRYDEQYGRIDEIEVQIDDVQSQIRSIRQEKISGDNIYRLLLAFDQVYEAASEVERKEFMRAFIERIELFPEKQPDGNWIRKIIFNFPVPVNGAEVKELPLENETMVETCLILFSQKIYQHLLDTFPSEKIGLIGACNGNIPIYRMNYKGKDIAFYLSGIGSAIAASECYEASWIVGASKFVMFGSCGSLNREATRGKFIVPTESYRGEGCSYYFAAPSDYITVENARKLSAIFTELGVPHVTGRVWTTDAMIRETAGLVAQRRSEGCLAVEMELAGVQAVCSFYGLSLYNFLEAGDVLEESGYDVANLRGANHDLGKLYIALETALRI